MTAAPPPAAKAAHQRAPSLEDAPKPLPPLLKWAGGKRWLTGHILKRLPRTYGTYLEPFAGGAALFFAIQPKKAILGDINGDLMEFYRQVRDEPEAVITAALQWPNTKETYLKVRALTPHNPAERAARLLYLTSLSFNGIYRVNLKGTFNVPYGHKCHVQPCDPARIRAASAALKCAQLETRDFFETAGMAQAGDLVYFDPYLSKIGFR